MFSMFGLIALAGVVVNDSLIMVDFINKARQKGVALRQAVIESGTARFRAIVLTSFTTAAGLMPILFETSTQATYVMPTAISISFGIVFATVITLFLIPTLYMLQEDGFAAFRRFKVWLSGPEASAEAPKPPIRDTTRRVFGRRSSFGRRPWAGRLYVVGRFPRVFQVDRLRCSARSPWPPGRVGGAVRCAHYPCTQTMARGEAGACSIARCWRG